MRKLGLALAGLLLCAGACSKDGGAELTASDEAREWADERGEDLGTISESVETLQQPEADIANPDAEVGAACINLATTVTLALRDDPIPDAELNTEWQEALKDLQNAGLNCLKNEAEFTKKYLDSASGHLNVVLAAFE